MGITTSGDYGHHVGQSLCFAYVTPAYATADQQFSISLYGQRHTATVLHAPAHDPTNQRLRT
jgi:dimethylglycine dehydrogenase